MELWTVGIHPFGNDTGEYFLLEDGCLIRIFRNRDRAQQITDEHNAWQILMERGWTIKQWSNGKYGVANNVGDCPHELIRYCGNAHDTPVAAILVAYAWLLKEIGK